MCVERTEGSLSEMKWYSHCSTLAQARWVSLSEADGLAWAKIPGLSENDALSMFV